MFTVPSARKFIKRCIFELKSDSKNIKKVFFGEKLTKNTFLRFLIRSPLARTPKDGPLCKYGATMYILLAILPQFFFSFFEFQSKFYFHKIFYSFIDRKKCFAQLFRFV